MSPRTFRVIRSKNTGDPDTERVISYMKNAGTACKVLYWGRPESEDIRRQALRHRILKADNPAEQEKVFLVGIRQSSIYGGLVNPTNEEMAVFIEATRKKVPRRKFLHPDALNP